MIKALVGKNKPSNLWLRGLNLMRKFKLPFPNNNKNKIKRKPYVFLVFKLEKCESPSINI
jgi:hypothetical protein